MNEIKLFVSAIIFILLTAIKITMPSLSDDVSYEISKVLITEHEQTVSVMELGASLTDGKVFKAFKADEYDDELISLKEIVNYENILPLPKNEEVEETGEEQEDKVSPKVAAFLESQEQYSYLSIPANVSYEMPELPFEYESPLPELKSSGFGYRVHPISCEVSYHYGTDIPANAGTAICAFADGVIRAIGEEAGYGKYIIIDHADGYSTLYAHCSSICISSGAVSMGDVISLVGQTGAATGPHLHFELMNGDTYLNPEFYI